MKNVTHLTGHCHYCNWVIEDYKDGLKLAKAHARKYKHVVTVEMGTVVQIGYHLEKRSKE
jgi:hypothetical protein